MGQKLNILIIEELLSETSHIERELQQADMNYKSLVAADKTAFKKALKSFTPDIILSAYSLPDLQILDVVKETQNAHKGVPIIMLTGELSEDMALEFLKSGVDDYILKPNFKRLPQAIENALKKKEITFQKDKAIEKLQRSEENFKQMIRNMPISVAMFDREMRYLAVSDQWLKKTKLPEDELIGKKHYDFTPHIQDIWVKMNDQCIQGKSVSKDEDIYIVPSGDKRWIRWKMQPWYDTEGKIGGAVLFVESIHERKEAEERLKTSEETFRQMAENITEVLWLTDWKTRKLIYISKTYEKVYGATCESLYENSRSWSQNIHPEDLDRITVAYQEKAEKGKYDVEYRICVNGKTKWVRDRAFPIKNEKGEIYRMAGLTQDITELKKLAGA